jgi:membrane protein
MLREKIVAMYGPIKGFVRQIFIQFIDDGCTGRAGGLAYASLLSLVPLMTVSFTVMSAFPIFRKIGLQVQDFIFKNFVATSAQIIQEHLQKFASQAANLSTTGLVFLLITAILMVFNMEQAFNAIWHVKRSRKGVQAFMMYWAVLTLLPVLIGIGFAISSYFFSLPMILGTAETLGLKGPILKYFPYVLTFIAFTVLYITLPNCKVMVRHAMVGGVVATVLFELAKYTFGLYVLHFPTYELLYGTLAAIPLFLLWVYVSWLVILFGAVVAHVLGTMRKEFIRMGQRESI